MRCTGLALGILAFAGCTGVPQSDDLRWDGTDPAGILAFETVPDADADEPAPPAPPVVPVATEAEFGKGPRIAVSQMRKSGDEDGFDYDGTALCPFNVEAVGFPAVSADGTKFAYWISETLSSSDGEDEAGTLRIVDVVTDTALETVVVFDGDSDYGVVRPAGMSLEAQTAAHCRHLRTQAKAQGKVANALLAVQGWNSMEELDLDTRDRAMLDDEDADGRAPAKERRVELVLFERTAAIRIPGVKVLARTQAGWNGGWESGCGGYVADIEGVYVDRKTSVAVAKVGQEGGPCFCYSATLFHVLPMTSEILATIDARNASAEA